MKFFNLLKKELRELITPRLIISLVVSFFLFFMLGNFMGGIVEEAQKDSTSVYLVDNDATDFTKSVISAMNDSGCEVKLQTIESDNYVEEVNRLGTDYLLVIPKGFTDNIFEEDKQGDLIFVSKMKGLGVSNNISSAGSSAGISILSQAVKTTLLSQKFSADETKLIDNPINLNETTIVGEKSSNISSSTLMGFVSMQGTFVPIIIFILIMFASQMIISAISTEKIDKTLETLLSAPVSRIAVLSSKMLAATIISALYAAIYMLGFSNMMAGIGGDAMSSSPDATNVSQAIVDLGLKMQTADYFMLGLQMFLTLLITLSVSLILGALAKDIKSAQTAVMPIMILAIIPYMISLFSDINTLPIVPRMILYAIPFTHTFCATSNILFDNNVVFWGGFAYQLLALGICMFFAVRVFMTDKLFTISLSFGQKKNKYAKRKGLFGKK